MFLVAFLRWLFGYLSFTAEGTFPESLMNLAARRGIHLWNMKGEEGRVSGCAREKDIRALKEIAEKTHNTFTEVKHSGLPSLLKTYRCRSGLLVGLIVCGIGYYIMSGFIWRLDIRTPDQINEYELREMLAEYGLKEGAWSRSLDVSAIVSSLSLREPRISWMTINLLGTRAEINISPRMARDEKSEAALSNMLSASDGTVTKVQVHRGTANVRVGDGIRKNQLLVSGVMEYNNGNIVLTDASARIYAETNRNIKICIPKTYDRYELLQTTIKRSLHFFGLTLPFSLTENPEDAAVVRSVRKQASVSGRELPICLTEETWKVFEKTPVSLTSKQAEKILRKKLSLYEFFMLSSLSDGTVKKRTVTLSEKDDGYLLSADYVIEEDVCVKSVVPVETEEE